MDQHVDYIEVRWKNFKGFKDTGWVKVKPITILIGTNNSGKTNFLAPFLLMNQTINSKDGVSPLILKGEIHDGGNYQEIVKDYITENEIFFGYRYHIHKSNESLKEIGEYPPGAFEVTFRVDYKEGEIKLKETKIYDIYCRKFLTLELGSSGRYKYSGIGSKSLNAFERKAISKSKPVNFLFSSNTILSEFEPNPEEEIKKRKGRIHKRPTTFSRGFGQFLSAISFNYSRAIKYLGDLSFIGPLRESPHRIYEVTNETYDTVGVKGENIANLIKKLGPNNKDLNEWVKKFGFGDKIELVHHHSNSHSLRFLRDDSNLYTTIANAGFGASQVLPLIVQALVSPERSITVAEQPEIHLNPKLQCVLADLFVYMAKKQQSVIVETHSEHLLLRLRTLIASKKIPHDNVAIYFIEKKGEDAYIKDIKIDENGHINVPEWPEGFFEDSLRESLSLAREQVKNKKRK